MNLCLITFCLAASWLLYQVLFVVFQSYEAITFVSTIIEMEKIHKYSRDNHIQGRFQSQIRFKLGKVTLINANLLQTNSMFKIGCKSFKNPFS